MATFKVNGTEIYYEIHGPEKATAVVISTPVFLDSTFYQDLAEHLKEDVRIVLYDHRGHGQSAPLAKRPDIESTTQDAIKLIEHLKLDPCIFVGNGLGAYVGLAIAVRRPDLVKRCLLMGALPEGESASRVKELDQFVEALKQDGMKTGVQSLMHSYFGESFLTSDDSKLSEMRERIAAHLLHLTPHQIDNIKQVFHRASISVAELKSIQAHVAIVVGEEDMPDRMASYRHLAEVINHSSYHLVPEAGYLVSLEQPEALAELIREQVEKSHLQFNTAQATQSKRGLGKHSRY